MDYRNYLSLFLFSLHMYIISKHCYAVALLRVEISNKKQLTFTFNAKKIKKMILHTEQQIIDVQLNPSLTKTTGTVFTGTPPARNKWNILYSSVPHIRNIIFNLRSVMFLIK